MSSIQNVHHTAPTQATSAKAQPSLGISDYIKLAAEKVLGKKADPPKVSDALKTNDFNGVERAFRSLDKKERLARLEEMRQQDPTSYKALLQDIRDGKIKDSEVTGRHRPAAAPDRTPQPAAS